MKRFGLIGYPLSHSFSLKFFAEKFARDEITDCLYDNFPIADIGGLPGLLHMHPDLHGLNVTIPYKEKVIPYLTGFNDVVAQTGACNCIRIDAGKLYGYNTDTTGFQVSLQTRLRQNHQKALILGKGGAAKAVAFVLRSLGIDFLYVVRQGTGAGDTIHYNDINEQVMRQRQLIVNTTPLGTFPDTGVAPPILYQYVSEEHYLYDLVYNPAKTLFLRLGEEKGATIQNGADMLVIQAEESWKIWNQ